VSHRKDDEGSTTSIHHHHWREETTSIGDTRACCCAKLDNYPYSTFAVYYCQAIILFQLGRNVLRNKPCHDDNVPRPHHFTTTTNASIILNQPFAFSIHNYHLERTFTRFCLHDVRHFSYARRASIPNFVSATTATTWLR